MESLRPERDELDQFKSRQTKKKNTKASDIDVAAKSSSKNTKITAGGEVQSRQRVVVSSQQQMPAYVVVLIAVLLVAVSGLSWVYWQQRSELADLKQNLEDATGFIGQSKLLMARLEGELSETGAELEQSGSAAEKKLAFLDSEMRKLWGVANDRNKKAIKSNTDSLTAIDKQQEGLSKKLAGMSAANSQQQVKFAGELKSVEAGLTKRSALIDGRVSAISNELAITRAEQEEVLLDVREALKNTQKSEKKNIAQIEKLSAQAQGVEKSIASIDASRRQLNERVVDLERKINRLQTSLKSSSVAKEVQ